MIGSLSSHKFRRVVLICISLFIHKVQAQELRTFIDLQIHMSMHVPYSFFGKGLTFFKEEPKLSYKHLLTNINYANYIEKNTGARIFVNGTICNELIRTKKGAKKKVLAQLAYINGFVANNPDKYALAKSPQELRTLYHSTNKTIIVHSIEGGKKLINSKEDAEFWADQGIAFVTLIHLKDDEFGGAATAPQAITRIINLKKVFRRKKKRGLTEKGKNAILWLADAGIMTDLTHMSDSSRSDALSFMEEHDIVPIVTHDLFKPIQNQPRGISREDILTIYKLGGFTSLPISGETTASYKPEAKFATEIDSLRSNGCLCEGAVDSYAFTYQKLMEFIQQNVSEIIGDPLTVYDSLSEFQKVRFSIGFQSDFNGWVNHSRPRFGKKGCYEMDPDKTYEEIELVGMPHPGLLQSQWNYMLKQDLDISPIERNAEHFVQIWEGFIERKSTLKENSVSD
ncbi:MAG: hypothetical protein COA38_13195 [Fluviicola sp.]|nr:MAG: hypothetical protein COA38_13195 [Fluviicola sp.]